MSKKIHIRRYNSAEACAENNWTPKGDRIGIAYCPKPGKVWGDSWVASTNFPWEHAERVGVMRLCRDSLKSLKQFARESKPDGYPFTHPMPRIH